MWGWGLRSRKVKTSNIKKFKTYNSWKILKILPWHNQCNQTAHWWHCLSLGSAQLLPQQGLAMCVLQHGWTRVFWISLPPEIHILENWFIIRTHQCASLTAPAHISHILLSYLVYSQWLLAESMLSTSNVNARNHVPPEIIWRYKDLMNSACLRGFEFLMHPMW